MVFDPRKPYKASHLRASESPNIFLNGHCLRWVSQFKYLGHLIDCSLSDGQDMRRVKRALYYSANILRAKVGYARKDILIYLFKSYCAHNG